MKTLTATEVARNFSAVMDGVEAKQEEVVLMRNQRAIAVGAGAAGADSAGGAR